MSPAVRRGLLVLGIGGFYAVFVQMYVEPLLRSLGIEGFAKFYLMGLAVSLAMAPLLAFLAVVETSRYSRARLPRPAVLATLNVAPFAVGQVLIYRAGDGFPILYTPVGLCLSTAAAWICFWRMFRRFPDMHVRRPVALDHLRDADDLVAECRRVLSKTSPSELERMTLELNLAAGLVGSSLGPGEDRLPEALDILARALDRGPADRTFAVAAALVEAMAVRATRTGELAGLEEALDVLLASAEKAAAQRPEAPPEALAARASNRIWLAEAAASDGDDERAERLLVEARLDAQQALDLAPKGSGLHAENTISLAWICAFWLGEDIDRAIASSRRALRRLWWLREPERRWTGYLFLSDLYSHRAAVAPEGGIGGLMTSLWSNRPRTGPIARVWPQRGTHDLLRALSLCMRVRGEMAPQGRLRAPDLMERLRTGEFAYLRLPPGRVATAYRRNFDEQSRVATVWSVRHAARWAGWAAEHGGVEKAAEAHWSWLRAAVAESRRRVLQAGKVRELSQIQGLVAETCAWLLQAGRTREAALACELGRAVLVTERMDRQRAGLEERLRRAGRADLGGRWRDAGSRMARMDRTAYDVRRDHSAVWSGSGMTRAAAMASPEHVTNAEYERVLREIADVPGFEDVNAPPTYDDLRASASDGPLVYLSATDRGGYAVIVTPASAPTVVELPSLTAGEIDTRAARLLRARDAETVAAEFADQLPWLWASVMQPLVAHLPPGSLVTLICIGALGQLPVHAAGADLGDDGVWREQAGDLVFRYAPNARVLRRAREAASALAGSNPRILTVPVPSAPRARRLPRVADESRGVTALFGTARTIEPSPCTVANVLAALDRCDVWHFACHGVHDPAESLDSYLMLADGPLRLREIFARPAADGRLAVLSACHTAMPDGTLLDEVVSFPSALLQIGIGGVVASQIAVDDEAAMLLVVRFFDRLRSRSAPARALAEAQAWLRGATNGEIHDTLPELYRAPAGCGGEALDAWRAERRFTEPCDWGAFSYSGG